MDTSPQELRVYLLGGFHVSVGPRHIHESEWRLRKTKNLVKLLALATDQHLHREQLVEVLWPDQDPDLGANNLHKAVHAARRAFEPDLKTGSSSRYLHVEGDSLVLRPPGTLWIDAEAFRRAAAAARRNAQAHAYEEGLRHYTGALLPEDRFEDWAAGPREELQALYLTLLLELAALHEAQAEPTAAVEALRRVVATDASHEQAHAALMRLYAQTGHRHQALRQDQHLREALRRELDVEPAPASQQLHADILAGRLAPAPPPTAGGSTTPAAPGGARWISDRADTGGRAALVGRDAEIERIEDALEALFAGRGGLVLLAGEAGIGKSRLAAEVAERVRRRGGTALVGAAYEQEGRLPYGPFVEALDQIGAGVAPGGLRALFGADATDFARLPPVAASAMRADRQRLFAGIADLLRKHAAAGPLLVVLDDLQFADEASLQLLHYLARTMQDCAVLFLGTFRPEDADAAGPLEPLGQMVHALQRESLSLRLDLGRLDPRESDLLVAALLDGAPVDRMVFEAVQRLAAGNPFFTEEVVRTLRERGQLQLVGGRWRLAGEHVPLPGPVLDLLVNRLDRLGPDAMQVLGAAAVVGLEASYPLLRLVSDLPDATALDALDRCLASHALQETTGGYRFGHPLQRAAVYERLSRARRTVLHGRVAAALEQLHSEQAAQPSESLAHHWALSEQPARAVPYLVQAGDRAAAVHANEAAGAAYRRALDLLGAPERDPRFAAELWEKIGDLHALAGESTRDEDAYRAAIRLLSAETSPPPDRLVRLHRKTAYAALARHDVDGATPHLEAAETIVGGPADPPDPTDTPEWGRVRLVRALWLWEQGRYVEGRQAAEESATAARQRRERMDLVKAYMTLALVFHSSGEWKRGLAIEVEHLGAAADADPRLGLLFDAHACLGEYHLYGGTSFEAIEAYANHTLELATRAGAQRAQALAWLLRGGALLMRGRWDDAHPSLERSLEIQAAVGAPAGQAFALQRLAELSVYRGDHAAADDHLRRAFGLVLGPSMAPHVLGRLRATAALNALERGDPTAASQIVERAVEAAMRTGECATCSALLHPVASQVYAALGDPQRAAHHADLAARVAAHWDTGYWRAMAEMAHAAVLQARAEHQAAAQRFLAAAGAFEHIGQPYDTARCVLGAGQATAGQGDPEQARGLVQRALASFESLGAVTAAARARQDLALLLDR
ncbi:MAG TPA: AAA family ATPase [Chloroflexota bacterium]|nr:AAA family ATPase [Chloroflexota bacterium]